MKTTKTLSLLLLCLLLAWGANAQVSIGFADISLVTAYYPAMKTAQTSLNNYRKKQQEHLKISEDLLRKKYLDGQQLVESGGTQEQIQALQTEIMGLEQQYQKKVQEMEAAYTKKQQELINPIYEKVNAALEAVSTKYSLDCILQPMNTEGVSVILFGPKENNLTPALFKELGIPLPEEVNSNIAFSNDPATVSIGYTNVEMILAFMPQMKEAEAAVDAFKKTLEKQVNKKDALLKAKYQTYLTKQKAGMSKDSLAILEKEIVGMEKDLQQFYQDSEQKVIEKQAGVLNPVLEELQKAIDEVAEANGYTFILNQTISSGGSVLLFGPDDADISAHVAQKVGAKTEHEPKTLLVKKNVKVGFCSVEVILGSMPRAKEIEQELQSYESVLMQKLQAKQYDLYELQQSYNSKMQDNSFAPGEQTMMEKDMKDKEDNMVKFSQDADAALTDKRQELLAPILTKLQAQIDGLAVSKGYTYIINQTTSNNVLYIKPEHDLTQTIIDRM